MTISLTNPISIPNLNRIKIVRMEPNEELQTALVTIKGTLVGGIDVGPWRLTIRNGGDPEDTGRMSTVIAANPTPSNLANLVTLTERAIPTAYFSLFEAWRVGETRADRLQACETRGLIDGWIDASLAGTVG